MFGDDLCWRWVIQKVCSWDFLSRYVYKEVRELLLCKVQLDVEPHFIFQFFLHLTPTYKCGLKLFNQWMTFKWLSLKPSNSIFTEHLAFRDLALRLKCRLESPICVTSMLEYFIHGGRALRSCPHCNWSMQVQSAYNITESNITLLLRANLYIRQTDFLQFEAPDTEIIRCCFERITVVETPDIFYLVQNYFCFKMQFGTQTHATTLMATYKRGNAGSWTNKLHIHSPADEPFVYILNITSRNVLN